MTATDGLFFDRVVKSFGGTQALRSVSLRVGRGEIVALLGENGAGKSTLIKTLGGIHKPDSGAVLIDGAPYAHIAGKSGGQAVAFIHQDLGLIEWMSVAENIALALGYVKTGRRIDWPATEARADAALKLVEAEFPASTRVSNLTRTQKSLVAIARALAANCDYLVLDEPTASLPSDEVERLFNVLRPLKAKGVGMIYVSHRLDEIFKIADRVAVLRDGQMVGMRSIDHTTPEELVSLIVGRKAREINRPAIQPGPEILRVENLATPAVGPVSFRIAQGEVLGLAGLRGAGHEDIGRALFGTLPHQGRISLEGQTPDLRSPQTAMQSGIGFVARDRVHESIAPGLSIRENAYLRPQGRPVAQRPHPDNRGAVGRQPAKGCGRALAWCQPPFADHRRPNRRRRRWRQGRNLPPAVSGAGLWHGRLGGVDRLRRNRQHLPPRHRVFARPAGSRTARRRTFHRIPDPSRLGWRNRLRTAPMPSIESNALEPTRDELATLPLSAKLGRLAPVYGLVILMFALILLFSILLPNSFPTLLNLRVILADKSLIALLSLAAMVPMVAGRIDLTVGYGIVLWHILAISLQTMFGVPWPVAVLIVLALGALVGVLNGFLVEVAKIDSFIATLGTGTVLYSIALWHTGGRQMVGVLPDGFYALNGTFIFGLPITAFYVLAITLVMWLILEYTPVGRYLYAIGANQRAAELNGIPTRKFVLGAFITSGFLTALTGVLLASKLRIGQASVGLEFLLPALVGAFLGSTTIKPGRVNVWGTIVGVAILAVGISGIQQFGGSFWVEPMFNGMTLLIAIGIAGYAQRKKGAAKK